MGVSVSVGVGVRLGVMVDLTAWKGVNVGVPGAAGANGPCCPRATTGTAAWQPAAITPNNQQMTAARTRTRQNGEEFKSPALNLVSLIFYRKPIIL